MKTPTATKILSAFFALTTATLSLAATSTEISEAKLVGNECDLTAFVAADGEASKATVGGLSAEANAEKPVAHKKCLLSLKLKVPEGFRVGVAANAANVKTKIVGAGDVSVTLKARFAGHPDDSTTLTKFDAEGEVESVIKGEEAIWSDCGVVEPALKVSVSLTAMVGNAEGAAASAKSEWIELPAFLYKKCPAVEAAN